MGTGTVGLDYEGRLRLRRAFGVVVPVALIGVLVGAVQAGSSGAAPPDVASAAPSATTATGLAPTTEPPAPSTVAPSSDPGVTMQVVPTAMGTLEVFERVVLTDPTISLGLAPPAVASIGSPFSSSRPAATSVQLVIDGQPLDLPSARVDQALSIALPRPARELELRYILDGSTVRSIPSSTGRAVIAVGPLSRVSPGDAVATVQVPTDTVRNITCPLASDADLVCASASTDGSRLVATVPVSDALVVLQVDLPRP